MSAAQFAALFLLVAQAVVAYLLVQTTVEFSPLLAVALGAISVGLNAAALYLKVELPGRKTVS